MNETLEQVRSLLRQADEALSRHAQPARTPKQRDADFDEALGTHRRAVAIMKTLQSRPPFDDAFVAELAPLQVDVADLESLISEIRFDEHPLAQRLYR